ncbi:MAG: MFS transporter [candidate division WOR-3 bacterium]
MSIQEYFKLFRLKSLIFLILSGTFSQFGDRLTHMLLITLVGLSAPGKVSAFSWAQLTFTLPVVLFSPLIGILVDSWSRRKVMIWAHVSQAFILSLTPFLISLTGSYLPFWIIITLFFTIDIFNNTAKPALMPSLVAPRKLLSVNSLDQFLARFATVAGMVLGGILVQKFGWRLGFIINALMHFSAGMLVLGISAQVEQRSYHRTCARLISYQTIFGRIIFDLKELISVIRSNKIIALVLSSFVVTTVIASVSYTILIFLVQQVLNWGTAGVGLTSGILALGMILGSLPLGLFKPRISKFFLITIGFFLYGLLFAIGPLVISRAFIIIVALGGGFIFSIIAVAQNTIIQEKVNANIRGRLFAIKDFLGNIAFMITALVIGFISDITSYKITLSAIGLCLLLVSLVYFSSAPKQLTKED